MGERDENATAGGGRADERLGTVVAGRYKLVERLGEGGMGAVYRAEHVGLRKPVAVKFLHREAGEDPTMRTRFEREAMAAANLSHPNVAEAMDFGRLDDGTYYLAMELVQGPSLRAALREAGRLPPRRALHIAGQIASALARAHALGVVHRDLKPENVVLRNREGEEDFVKVIDFGVARVRGPAFAAGTGLTQVGTVVGTPAYMAPEQCLGQTVDGRADQYALGVMLFEMLTGRQPFTADDAIDLLRMHVGAPVPRATELAPEIPPGVDAVLARMLAKRPGERFESAEEAVGALGAALAGAPVPASPPAAGDRGSATVREAPGLATVPTGPRGWSAATQPTQPARGPRAPAPLLLALGAVALGAVAAGVWWGTRTPGTQPAPAPVPSSPASTTVLAPAPSPTPSLTVPTAPTAPETPAAPGTAPAAVIPQCEGDRCQCVDVASCNQMCTAPGCDGECRRVDQCQLGCGEACHLRCRDGRSCALRCADHCRAECVASNECSVECGEGCRVDCRAMGTCTVRMSSGEVRCRQTGRCDVRCVGEDGQERAAGDCGRDVYRCPPEACEQ